MSLTNQFFYEHFLSINSTPFNANFFKGPPVSQNVLRGILYRVKTTRVFWWSDKQMDIVLHGCSRFMVRSVSDGIRVIRWNDPF